ncbi:hypothetical protein [Spiroplasma endosymbiont of Dasysyrphus albostriatus]|uniref:hypothetical protein n=1 Tax=Spiroplasma endosymbiont of Dasysyrphus albostriatus TaxID=3066299 RepID=UPI0030D18F35
MKTLLTAVSLLTFATTTGNLNSILSTQIKTTNILNNEPIKYDGENKIITNYENQYELAISYIYINNSTLDTWFKLFSLNDLEKLREKIYYDTSSFPYQGNGWEKISIYELTEKLINNFSSLINVRGYNTYGIIVTYHEAPKELFFLAPQFSPNTHDKNIIEKYYKFLWHDTLKIALSRYEWQKILNTNKNITEIFNIISRFPEWDASGWKGYISNEDLYTLSEKIIENFNQLKTKFENSNTGWKVVTNTTGSWTELEQE